jgi:hypothetical protein
VFNLDPTDRSRLDPVPWASVTARRVRSIGSSREGPSEGWFWHTEPQYGGPTLYARDLDEGLSGDHLGWARSTNYVRFEVLTAVTMKNCVFWDVTPRGNCTNRRFGGT